MAEIQVDVDIIIGGANAEGLGGDTDDLPARLKAQPISDAYIHNHDNGAIEALDAITTGANLPNNTTSHTAGQFGPEMSLANIAKDEKGHSFIFKLAYPDASLSPYTTDQSIWNPYEPSAHNELFDEFQTKWAAFIALLKGFSVGGGDTVDADDPIANIRVYWIQGEVDGSINGPHLAYEGCYKAFIAEMKAYLSGFTNSDIIWVDALPSTTVPTSLLDSTINKYDGIDEVRRAKIRVGLDDPNYRILDTEGSSLVANGYHFDSDAQIALGNSLWETAQLRDNNVSLLLDDYTLEALRTRIAREFGLDTDNSEIKDLIDEKINDAQQFIIERIEDAEWLWREVGIQVGRTDENPSESFIQSSARLTDGSKKVSGIQSSVEEFFDLERAILAVGESPSNTDGYLITHRSGGLTLQRPYFGDSNKASISLVTKGNPTTIKVSTTTDMGGITEIPDIGQTFSVEISGNSGSPSLDGIYQATRTGVDTFTIPVDSSAHTKADDGTAHIARVIRYFQFLVELPGDVNIVETAYYNSDVDNKLSKRDFNTFIREIKNKLNSNLNRLYTVMGDILGKNDKKYLAVYPYINTRDVIFVQYYASPKKLVADSDIPILPRHHRMVLFHLASWFVAQQQKEMPNSLQFHRDQGITQLERLVDAYKIGTEDDESLNMMSRDSDGVPGVPQHGGSYPEFEL